MIGLYTIYILFKKFGQIVSNVMEFKVKIKVE